MRAAVAAATLALAIPAMAGEFKLSTPIDCTLGDTCHIQQFTDQDPGPGARDFRCGTLSYDGHKGTDFALPTLADMERGVAVLAAAGGTVQGLRDMMPDTGFTPETADTIKGRDCGNGVVLRHPDGWETQYCHLRQGSVRVKSGQRVKRGAILGQVGLSGRTQFPHLHLSVRRNGDVVDPFDADDAPGCDGPMRSLWETPPIYQPGGLIYGGFASSVPTLNAIRAGRTAPQALTSDAPALVLFGYAYGGQIGDVMEIAIHGPRGTLIDERATLDKDQAQFFRAVGKRRRGEHWPTGPYSGKITLIRNGNVIDRLSLQLSLN